MTNGIFERQHRFWNHKCHSEGKFSVKLTSPDMCDSQQSSWRSTEVWGETPSCSFLLHTVLKVPRPTLGVQLYWCFKKWSSHPEKVLTLRSVFHTSTRNNRCIMGNHQVIKCMFTGKVVRLLFFFLLTYIINSLQVVYKHWYRLKIKLESSIDFLSVSVHCVVTKSNNLFKCGVSDPSDLSKHRPVA